VRRRTIFADAKLLNRALVAAAPHCRGAITLELVFGFPRDLQRRAGARERTRRQPAVFTVHFVLAFRNRSFARNIASREMKYRRRSLQNRIGGIARRARNTPGLPSGLSFHSVKFPRCHATSWPFSNQHRSPCRCSEHRYAAFMLSPFRTCRSEPTRERSARAEAETRT
jgi:hypothetical protein